MGSRCFFLRLHVWSMLILIAAGWSTVWADFRDGEQFDITKIVPMAILETFKELPLESLFYVYFDIVLNGTDYASSEAQNIEHGAINFLLTKGHLATVGVIDQSGLDDYDQDTLDTIRRFNNLSYQTSSSSVGARLDLDAFQHSIVSLKNLSTRISLVSTLPVFANIVEHYYFKREEFNSRGDSLQVQTDFALYTTHENACHNDFTIKNIIKDIQQRAQEHCDPEALQLLRDLHTTIEPEELWGLCHCCQQGIVFQGNTWCGIADFLTLKPVIRKIFGQQAESKKQRYIRLCKKHHEKSAPFFLSTEEKIAPLYFRAIEHAPPGCESIASIKRKTQWHIAQLRWIKETANMLCVGTTGIVSLCTLVGLVGLAAKPILKYRSDMFYDRLGRF